MMIEKKEIGAALEEIALLIELKGENTFKARAYEAAARTIERLPGPIEDLPGLTAIPGIGLSIAAQIESLLRTGSSPLLVELRAALPDGLRELLRLPGLGPRRARLLWKEIDVASINDLEDACIENRVRSLAGFGDKTQANILNEISIFRGRAGLFLLPDAWEAANEVLASFGRNRIEVAGELRRQLEVLREVLFLAEGPPGEESRRSSGGIPVRILWRSPEAFDGCWLWESSSEEHRASLAARAIVHGFHFDAQGFGRDRFALPFDEERIYRSLGLDPVHPLLREGPVTGAPHPSPLVGPETIRGVFHVHTTDSDGTGTIAEMVGAAARLGYEWIGISDHSQTPVYANGLSPDRLRAQAAEIRRIQPHYPSIRIFHGVESDILFDGSLDYDDALLGELDFVVASIHSSMRMPREEMTRRIEKALRHPATTHWGHPSGRVLLAREPYECDIDHLLEVCAESGVSVEFNAHPSRLDLDWRRIPRAIELGVPISVDPDAHTIKGLGNARITVGTAAKGGLTPAGVWNSRGAEEVSAWLLQKKRA